jgi:tRNA pseudouridine55 synthase
LILCTGKFTKRINEYMAQEKEYTGTITLGAETPTYDLESVPENFKSIDHITLNVIKDAALHFTGEISQLPPKHSAVKQKGKPVYLLARAGKEVVLEPRQIHIKHFDILSCEPVQNTLLISFRVVCSTGTYIRSLAHDIGQHLGCGGYLSSLRRTKIGEYHVEKARSVDETISWIREIIKKDN